MSRLFDGVNDRLDFTGTPTGLTNYTIVELIKLDSGVSWQGFTALENSGTHVRGNGRHSSGNQAHYSGGGVNTQQGTGISNSDGWFVNACRRPAGVGQTVRFMKHPIGGSPTYTNSGSGQDNPGTHNQITFGHVDESDWFKGRVAAIAVYNTALSDADMASLATTLTRANWLSKSGCVFLVDELDNFATDYAGTAAETVTGTTDDADDPAGWGSWAGGGSHSMTLTPATETDAAQALSFTKTIRKTLTPVTETVTAQPLSVTHVHFRSITPAAESVAAQALTFSKRVTLGVVTETVTAQPLSVTHVHYRTITPAEETNTAQGLTFSQEGTQFITLTAVSETNEAQALVYVKPIRMTLVPATETDTATALSFTGGSEPVTTVARAPIVIGRF